MHKVLKEKWEETSKAANILLSFQLLCVAKNEVFTAVAYLRREVPGNLNTGNFWVLLILSKKRQDFRTILAFESTETFKHCGPRWHVLTFGLHVTQVISRKDSIAMKKIIFCNIFNHFASLCHSLSKFLRSFFFFFPANSNTLYFEYNVA